jgi:hypothetical protein
MAKHLPPFLSPPLAAFQLSIPHRVNHKVKLALQFLSHRLFLVVEGQQRPRLPQPTGRHVATC